MKTANFGLMPLNAPERIIFRASAFWTVNLCLAPVAGFGGGLLIVIWNYGELRGAAPVLLLLGIGYVTTLLAYFPGNLVLMWPYAVEVDPETGLWLCGPLKKLFIPMSQVGEIENSLAWQGDVIHLLKPHGILTRFIIPWYFGGRRSALVDTIRKAARERE